MIGRLLASVCSLFIVAGCAQAGLFKNSVDLADLAEVAPESLDELRDTEFAAFVAEVQLNSAKAAERRAGGAVKATNRTLEAENLDMKAAEAEHKAAKANQDTERSAAAEAQLSAAAEDLRTAKALRAWKSQEQAARQAEVTRAKAALDLAEARRDAARVRLLQRDGAPSAERYDLGDIERNVGKRQKEHDAAERKARARLAKLDAFRLEWERLAKHVDDGSDRR